MTTIVPAAVKPRRRRTTDTMTHGQLVMRRFRKHKLAVISLGILIVFYALAIFCEFFAPYGAAERFAAAPTAPPQAIRLYDGATGVHLQPFVYGYGKERDKVTYRAIYVPDPNKLTPIQFFVHGSPYSFFGLVTSDVHFFGSSKGQVFLFGTDSLGRDIFSRTLYGARISMTIGLVGVALSLLLGILLGGIAGYFGGIVDTIVMRMVDLFISIPTLPLWMGLAAAVPRDWSVAQTYFAMTLILSLFGWTHLARVIRGKFLSLRDEDYVLAAKLSGGSEAYVILRHLVPAFTSYIIVSLTLAIPNMILGETVLSFLGLGLQPPAVSWGTLLQDAQNVQAIAQSPWFLLPALPVIITVLAFNFLGDGLRDAADPYSS
ncbi:MAG TPA: ABC transporter permease [Devosiaceae bacterium]|jgi:peptide/nickel transport system permease protein